MHKIVLIIGTFGHRANGLESAWKMADRAEAEGSYVCAPCLDHRYTMSPEVDKVRTVEEAAIRRKFPDEVRFVDAGASDSREILAVAVQFGYAARELLTPKVSGAEVVPST